MSADRSTASSRQSGPEQLSELIANGRVVEPLRAASPTAYAAAEGFWRSGSESSALSPRMRELVLLALNATPTTLHGEGVKRHVDRAKAAGASDRDVIDVLITIAGVSNHALYWSLPILVRELQAAGRPADFPLTPAAQKIKEDFIRERGFWNEQRDVIARTMPDYFAALNELSTESWKNGSLSNKERELICIAIDCTITHMYEPGLVIHIRNALKQGATVQEILAVYHLTALTGITSYVLGAEALFSEAE